MVQRELAMCPLQSSASMLSAMGSVDVESFLVTTRLWSDFGVLGCGTMSYWGPLLSPDTFHELYHLLWAKSFCSPLLNPTPMHYELRLECLVPPLPVLSTDFYTIFFISSHSRQSSLQHSSTPYQANELFSILFLLKRLLLNLYLKIPPLDTI